MSSSIARTRGTLQLIQLSKDSTSCPKRQRRNTIDKIKSKKKTLISHEENDVATMVKLESPVPSGSYSCETPTSHEPSCSLSSNYATDDQNDISPTPSTMTSDDSALSQSTLDYDHFSSSQDEVKQSSSFCVNGHQTKSSSGYFYTIPPSITEVVSMEVSDECNDGISDLRSILTEEVHGESVTKDVTLHEGVNNSQATPVFGYLNSLLLSSSNSPNYQSEKCSSCNMPVVLVEHSGSVRCINRQCSQIGRRSFIVDGDSASLPFGADISYSSLSHSNFDHAYVDALRNDFSIRTVVQTLPTGEEYKRLETFKGSSQSHAQNLFASYFKGNMNVDNPGVYVKTAPVSTIASISSISLSGKDSSLTTKSFSSMGSGSTAKYGRKTSSSADDAFTMLNNDAHFMPVAIVFGYSQSNKARHSSKIVPKPQFQPSIISPGVIAYVEQCLCLSTCGVSKKSETNHVCKWKTSLLSLKNQRLAQLGSTKPADDISSLEGIPNIAELNHILLRICGQNSDQQWSSIAKNKHCAVYLFSKILGYKPKPPTLKELDDAFKIFHLAKQMHSFKTGYIWYKIFQILYTHSEDKTLMLTSQFFQIPTNPDKLAQNDHFWKMACDVNEWPFIASVRPIIVNKKSVVLFDCGSIQ